MARGIEERMRCGAVFPGLPCIPFCDAQMAEILRPQH